MNQLNINIIENNFYDIEFKFCKFLYDKFNGNVEIFLNKTGNVDFTLLEDNIKNTNKNIAIIITEFIDDDTNTLKTLSNIIKKYDIRDRVFLFTCCHDNTLIDSTYHINTISYDLFSEWTLDDFKTVGKSNFNINDEYNKRNFLSLNNFCKSHRVLFLNNISKYNFEEYFYLTYTDEYYNHSNDLPYKHDCKVDLFDYGEFHGNNAENTLNIKNIFEQTKITIVSESTFFQKYGILSEKIMQPIIFKKPFIIVGTPNILDLHKKRGFKSFGDIFDESYDEIINPYKRMDAIFKLIMNLNYSDINLIVDKCQDIVEYNYNHFWNKWSDNFYGKNDWIFQ